VSCRLPVFLHREVRGCRFFPNVKLWVAGFWKGGELALAGFSDTVEVWLITKWTNG